MSIAKSRITAHGQISISGKVCIRLGVAPGSILEWYEQDEKVFVRRASKYTLNQLTYESIRHPFH